MPPTFTDLGVPADLVAALATRGITEAFDVQAAAIPHALAGRDVAAQAPTGSGKTLAFGLPLLARLPRSRPKRPRALVLAPTRELANQICRELEPLAAAMDRRVVAVYGGVGYEGQRKALRRGADLVVACPGRLLDLVDRHDLSLHEVTTVVIDEADRMADMGFLPAVRKLVDMTSSERQTLLFSATLDKEVGKLVNEYQNDPSHHDVRPETPGIEIATHEFPVVHRNDRIGRLVEVLSDETSAIVFCRTRHGADRVVVQLGRAGVHAVAIHGGHAQNRRERALRDFTRGAAKVLIATDVAARGIDVPNVGCVVHFDSPEDAKAYVHRSGRTARAGAGARVVSFVPPEDVRKSDALRRELGLPTTGHADAPGRSRPPAHRNGNRGRNHTEARRQTQRAGRGQGRRR